MGRGNKQTQRADNVSDSARPMGKSVPGKLIDEYELSQLISEFYQRPYQLQQQ
jgi:hypothetical protein